MLQSLGHMPVLSLSSIIDILFVALIVYGFLKLLKWTHAMPALLGVALVVLLVYWAHFKGLNTMDWMVTAVAPLTIFALIVVFAAEIRMLSGTPWRSHNTWIFEPGLPRSTGFGPVASLFLASRPAR